MKLADVLKKVTAGEELTAEEQDFLKSYKEPEAGIPKSRLDAEIAKRKEAETKATENETKLSELQDKVENLENAGMTEVDKVKKEEARERAKLQQAVDTLTKERDMAKKELENTTFKSAVAKLATANNFSDPGYLEFLIKEKKGEALDMADEKAVGEFITGLKTSSPKLFKVDVTPGGGTGNHGRVSGAETVDFQSAKEKGDINKMLENAPEIKQ